MTKTLIERSHELIKCLGEAGITLVEWDVQLFITLGVPLAENGVIIYLALDDDLFYIRDAASELQLFPSTDPDSGLDYTDSMPPQSLHFRLSKKIGTGGNAFSRKWLVFAPLSWTGIQSDEILPRDQISFEPRTPRWGPPPCRPSFVKTISIGSLACALIRIASRYRRGCTLRYSPLRGLSTLIGYCLFDMSYEGSYMDIPGNDVPLSDQEKADMEVAAADIQAWKFREDEVWMQDFLIQAVRGEKRYQDMPCPNEMADHA